MDYGVAVDLKSDTEFMTSFDLGLLTSLECKLSYFQRWTNSVGFIPGSRDDRHESHCIGAIENLMNFVSKCKNLVHLSICLNLTAMQTRIPKFNPTLSPFLKYLQLDLVQFFTPGLTLNPPFPVFIPRLKRNGRLRPAETECEIKYETSPTLKKWLVDLLSHLPLLSILKLTDKTRSFFSPDEQIDLFAEFSRRHLINQPDAPGSDVAGCRF